MPFPSDNAVCHRSPRSGRGLQWLRIAPIALCTLILAACGAEPLTPEAQLRAAIEAGVKAVESRDLAAAMERVDPDYRDSRKRDWQQMRGLLAGYFFRHRSIYVISKVDRIEILEPDKASVVIYAGLAGSAQEAAGPLGGWRGNLLRLDLEFRRHDEAEWRLASADWRQATREDFAQ